MNYNEFQIRFNKELKSKIHRDVFFDSLFIGGAIAATIILQLIAPFFFAIFYEGSIFERLVAFQDDVVALSLLSGVTLVIPPSFGILSFCFFILFMGFSRQEY